MQNVILDDKDFFDWLKTKQTNGKLTQTQVDGGSELLAVVKPDVLQECLAKINKWDLPTNEQPSDTRQYNLTEVSLKKVYPNVNVKAIPFILKHAPKYNIITKKQMCAFIATCLIESDGFNAKRESFNYRPERLLAVFPTRIPNLNFARNLIAKGQTEVANHLYGNRYGNRPNTNDGWDYRGGGIIQNTFRSNYYELQVMTGIPFGDNPKLIEDLENSVIAAMAFWKLKGINEMAEKINTYANGYTLNTLDSKGIETNNYEMNYGARIVRKAVNGGKNGFTEFCLALEKCLKHL